MIVNVNDEKYKVYWRHYPENKYPGVSTICYIAKGLLPTLNVITGSSSTSKKDSFNYDKGRKLSLGRALQELFPLPPEPLYLLDREHDEWGKDKENVKYIRSLFWVEYHKMVRKDINCLRVSI
ncbi:MAG: hypothetical protein WC346_14140 [Methanogenium sp.]|jgi:hypothetical protein